MRRVTDIYFQTSVPREQVEKLHELSTDSASALGVALVKIAARVVEAAGTDQYNILVNNGKDSGQVKHFKQVRKYRLTFYLFAGDSTCAFPHYSPKSWRLLSKLGEVN